MGIRKNGWLMLLLVAAVFAVYSGVARNGFLAFDDDINLTGNPYLRGVSSENLQWMFTDTVVVRRYIPLGWLGWNILYAIFGLNPAAFHLANLALHAANAVLVYALLKGILDIRRARQNESHEGDRWPAAIGALLWALHPMRVEPVAWASGYLYCQASFFLLISVLCYLQYCVGQGRKTMLFVLSLVSFAASLLTYPIALFAVFLLTILDIWVLHRLPLKLSSLSNKSCREVLLEKVPFYLVMLFVLGVTFWARANPVETWKAPTSVAEFGVTSRVMQAFYVWAYYLWKPMLPLDLAPFYTTLVKFDPLSPVFLFSMALVVGVTGFLLWQRQRRPLLLACWLGYLLLLIPMLGFTEHPHYTNDRYSYLAGILGALLCAGLLQRFRERGMQWREAATGFAAVIVLAAGWASHRQLQAWRSNETLFSYIAEKVDGNHHKASFYNRLAGAYENEQDVKSAIDRYKVSLTVLPNQPHVVSQIAWLLATAEDESVRNGAEALRYARDACSMQQVASPRSLCVLAAAYAECSRFAEAVSTLEKAQELYRMEGNDEMLRRNSQVLAHYQRERPLRELLPGSARAGQGNSKR